MNSNPRGPQTPQRPNAPQRPSAPRPSHPPQRSTRPPQRPSRPPQRPSRPPQKQGSSVPTAFWVILVVTVILVAALLITLTVILCLPDKPSEPSGGGGGGNTPKETTTVSPPPASKPSVKTGISLPSATKAGTYVYSTATATDISGDSGLLSNAAALIDITNGKAVATKNGSSRIYPASMTKVMTLLVACENATDPTALLTVTDEMVAKYKSSYNPGEKAPSVAHTWQAGYQVTVEDALYMVIYESDTYACWLLAEHIAGSEAAFVQMMNQRATALGCTGTNFVNSTGLEASNHYTTCFDLAAIMAAAMNNEAATKVLTRTTQYTADIYINGTKKSNVPMWSGWYTGRLETYRYANANGKPSLPKYAGNGSDIELSAGKTGYETTAQYCFVTAGRNTETGTVFVCVQAGAPSPKDSTDDSREVYQRYATY